MRYGEVYLNMNAVRLRLGIGIKSVAEVRIKIVGAGRNHKSNLMPCASGNASE